MITYPFENLKPINLYNAKNNKRDKQPAHLKTKTRQRWWGDKLLGECFCCNRKLHYDDADVGHIQAASKSGKWSPENCRLICRTCNSGMRNTNMKTYMKKYFPEKYSKKFPKDKIKESKKPIKRKSSKPPEGLLNIPKWDISKF
ncbi:HNH endonuclease [Candidatus Woesearchaeota archaeon]|nr:HNH endonuclease [Candidatus Woesearchaeota archaeon]